MFTKMLLAVACMALMMSASVSAHQAQAADRPLTLVRDGQPQATIVIPRKAAGPISQAARDLQHYIQRISGVELRIVLAGRPTQGVELRIGLCDAAQATLADVPDRSEAWAIVEHDGHVCFVGQGATPTAMAVHAFLHDELGVRWFAPGELWEHVPTGEPGALTVTLRPRRDQPDLSPRIWSGHDWEPAWDLWRLRNGAVQSERIAHRRFQNYMYRIFPPSRYGKTHPHLYPLVNGKRWIPSTDNYRYWWPCLSDPQVLALTVAHARERFDEHPGLDSFSLGMDDVAYMCECDACQAMDGSPDDLKYRVFSDRYYAFVNKVAGELKKTHPDRFVGVLIYNNVRPIPTRVEKLEDNVFGYMTQTAYDWWRPAKRQEDQELARQWAGRVKHLYRYDYIGLTCFTPRVASRFIQEQFELDRALGVRGTYIEAYTFLPHTAPLMWAIARMQQDRSQSMDALLAEFYNRMYGQAAGDMADYFNLLEQGWSQDRPGRSIEWVHRNVLGQLQALTGEQARQAMAMLDKAHAASADPLVQQRIAIHRDALAIGQAAIDSYDRERAMQRRGITSQADAESLIADLHAIEAHQRHRQALWRQAAERDDLLGQTVRGLGALRSIQWHHVDQWEGSAVMQGVSHLMAWLERHPAQRRSAQARLAQDGGPLVTAALATWHARQARDTVNALANAALAMDHQAAGTAAAVPEDWRSQGVPQPWYVWSQHNHGRWGVERPTPDATPAFFMSGVAKAALIQRLPVKPGQRWTLSARTRLDPAPQGASAGLVLRFVAAAGQKIPNDQQQAEVQLPADGDGWQRMHLLDVTVPQGAVEMRVMIMADRVVEDGRVWFDQLQLTPLPAADDRK